jgi:deoxyadenosine/deoxycytidine kinase
MKFVIDGNIGAGKTTQLELLAQRGFTVVCEPIEKWPLDLFYKDMSRWALSLQIAIMQTHQPIHTKQIVVYERSLHASRYVFWENMKNSNRITSVEDDIHERAFETYRWMPDVYIYLSVDPHEAYERIRKRKSQSGDSGVTLEYLKEIHVLYERMLMNMPCVTYIVKVSGREPEEIHAEILEILSKYTVNGMHLSDDGRKEMQKARAHRRTMLCTPFPDMCRVS